MNGSCNVRKKDLSVAAAQVHELTIPQTKHLVNLSDVPLTVADSRTQNPIKQMLGSGVHFHPRPWFPCGRLHRRIIALIDDHKDALDNKPLNRLSGDVWQTMLSVSTRKGGGTSTQRNALLSQQVV